MEHRLAEPTSETVGTPKRRTLFDMIENPEPGWRTHYIRQRVSSDAPPVWEIELLREADGTAVGFENESLFVAWARATEAAHMMSAGLVS